MKDVRERAVSGLKRIVIKVGSRVLTDPEKGLDKEIFRSLARDIASIKKSGIQVIVVSSGAVAAGITRLKLKKTVSSIPQKQAVAAVGQSALMRMYERAFDEFDEKVAQLLLTHDDLGNRKRFLNARNTIFTLLRFGIIPIINENDTVAVDEIKFGENDYLSALVVNLVEADVLILLSHVDGLYTRDPEVFKDREFIPLVEKITPELKGTLGTGKNDLGTGGMVSKIEAAEKVSRFGIPTVIANGKNQSVIRSILDGSETGTLILPADAGLSSKKHWIAHALRPAGAPPPGQAPPALLPALCWSVSFPALSASLWRA